MAVEGCSYSSARPSRDKEKDKSMVDKNINKAFLVNRHQRIAEQCAGVVETLEKVAQSNMSFFLETGGYTQIEMYKVEIARQYKLAEKQGEYHGLESV